MASPDIEPQVMEIGPLLGQRLDESAPPTLPLTAREVHVGAGGPIMTVCGSRKQPA
jgi:hypothetical protein